MTKIRKMIPGLILLTFLAAGCAIVPEEQEKRQVEFTVVSEECIPEQLSELIELKKEQDMKFTYIDGEERYIVAGYGRQESGGYSICVKDFYATDNALYLDTCLLGPKTKEGNKTAPSYPYIVLRTKEIGLPVVFQ
jgi:hypothetical protein